jgi:ribosomal protein L40E
MGQVVGQLPWVWILAGAAFLLSLLWLGSRPLPLQVAEAMRRLQLERAVCRYCGHQLEAQSITCRGCGKVAHWANVAGAAGGLLITFAYLVYVVVRVH